MLGTILLTLRIESSRFRHGAACDQAE